MTGYRDIRDTLIARIRSGALGPGALLPSEIELAQEFGVARATVSKALGELAGQGLIERRRRAGTRVTPAPARRAQLEILQAGAEIAAAGMTHGYELLSADHPVPPEVAAPLGPDPLGLLCLHRADGAPWQVEERWISRAAVPGVDAVSFGDAPPGPWLVAEVPLTDALFHFAADPAPAPVACALGISPGTPVFVAERTTWRDGQAVTCARLWHAPGYRMSLRHSPTDDG